MSLTSAPLSTSIFRYGTSSSMSLPRESPSMSSFMSKSSLFSRMSERRAYTFLLVS